MKAIHCGIVAIQLISDALVVCLLVSWFILTPDPAGLHPSWCALRMEGVRLHAAPPDTGGKSVKGEKRLTCRAPRTAGIHP